MLHFFLPRILQSCPFVSLVALHQHRTSSLAQKEGGMNTCISTV